MRSHLWEVNSIDSVPLSPLICFRPLHNKLLYDYSHPFTGLIEGFLLSPEVCPEAARHTVSVLKCFWAVTSRHFLCPNVIDWAGRGAITRSSQSTFIETFQARLNRAPPGPLNEKKWTSSGLVHPWAYRQVNDRNCTCQYYRRAHGLNNVHVIERSGVLALMC